MRIACVLFKLGFHGRAIEKNEVLISESLFKRGEKELLTNSRCSLQSKQDRRRVKAILLKRVFVEVSSYLIVDRQVRAPI